MIDDRKGQKPRIKAKIVSHIDCVDMVIAENSWEQKVEDIKKYGVDVFVIGDDWEGKFDFLKEFCEVVYLKRTEDISSSNIKENLEKNFAQYKKPTYKQWLWGNNSR